MRFRFLTLAFLYTCFAWPASGAVVFDFSLTPVDAGTNSSMLTVTGTSDTNMDMVGYTVVMDFSAFNGFTDLTVEYQNVAGNGFAGTGATETAPADNPFVMDAISTNLLGGGTSFTTGVPVELAKFTLTPVAAPAVWSFDANLLPNHPDPGISATTNITAAGVSFTLDPIAPGGASLGPVATGGETISIPEPSAFASIGLLFCSLMALSWIRRTNNK